MAALLGAVLWCAAAAAAEPDPDRATRAEISAGALSIRYAEREPGGALLDRERGWLPVLSASVEERWGTLFFRGAARLADGAVAYDGRVQSANVALNGLPARSTSNARFVAAELQVGRWVDASRRVVLFGGLGARRWYRDIQSTTVVSRAGDTVAVSGLSENYSWYELQAGVRWTFLRSAWIDWAAEGRLGRTVAPRIAVTLFGRDVVLALAERTVLHLGTTLRRKLAPELFLAVGCEAEWYGFGASAPDPATRVLEPDSTTWNVAFLAGVGGHF